MNKNLLNFLTTVFLFSLNSCFKKGPEDPIISFHSRKGRVVGEWKAASGSVTISTTSYSESYSVSGNSFNYQGPNGYLEGTADVAFSFDRKGDAKITINLGGFINVYNGIWNFSGGIGDKKSKTEIIMHPNDYTDANGLQTITGDQYDLTYDIVELKNKEMKLHLSYKRLDPTGVWNAYDESWTLKQ